MKNQIAVIEAKMLDSSEWLRDRKTAKYKHARPCEECYLGGLAFAMSAIKGTTPADEYQRALGMAKKKVVRRRLSAAPKKKIVRRKK